jgi:hypothetical protein
MGRTTDPVNGMRDALLENGAAGIFGQVEIAGLNAAELVSAARERRGAADGQRVWFDE